MKTQCGPNRSEGCAESQDLPELVPLWNGSKTVRPGPPRFRAPPSTNPFGDCPSFNQPFRGFPTARRLATARVVLCLPCASFFYLFWALGGFGSPINGCKTASGSLPEASGLLGACKTASESLLEVPTFQKPLPPWNGCKTTPGGSLLEAPTPSGMVVKRFRVVFKNILILDQRKG